ncbi:MAG: hypothetical protein ACM3O8_09050, partial [Methylococcaceae bacterium]
MKFPFNTNLTGTVRHLPGEEPESMNICGVALLCLPGSINRQKSIFYCSRIILWTLLMTISIGNYAQTPPTLGDYQSVTSGNWSD